MAFIYLFFYFKNKLKKLYYLIKIISFKMLEMFIKSILDKLMMDYLSRLYFSNKKIIKYSQKVKKSHKLTLLSFMGLKSENSGEFIYRK